MSVASSVQGVQRSHWKSIASDTVKLLDTALSEPTVLASGAMLRGKALLVPLQSRLEDPAQENPSREEFYETLRMFKLASHLEPENDEAKLYIKELNKVLEALPMTRPPEPNHDAPLDVIIVGAGAAGIGVAIALTKTFGLDSQRVLLVERGEMVGESFRRWPKEMRFISPSFNQQGWTNSFDLNSVAFGTSPAYTLGTEHPTGIEYACYLSALAESNELNIRFLTEVNSVRPQKGGGFEVDTTSQASAGMLTLCSRYVIWAAGEFQYPRSCNNPQFPGSEICCHNSGIQSWEKLPGDNFVIIGGYESGMDAAYNIALRGETVYCIGFYRLLASDNRRPIYRACALHNG